MKKIIIVSAINLVEGGPLTILQEGLRYLSVNLSDEYEIIALVSKKDFFSFKNINYLEFSKSKKSWINRLFYEYFYFSKLAKRYKPFLWLSFHDMTPNVTVPRLAVYCHNPTPFYRSRFHIFQLELKFLIFNLFYRYLYRINIHKNTFVIVQQDWIRNEFIKRFGLKNVIVAHPETNANFNETTLSKSGVFTFIYPAFPRFFKNLEVVCLAANHLYQKGVLNFKVILTIDGSESLYSRLIYNKFKHIPVLSFIGLQLRNKIFEYYGISDCLVFSSKLETWGLPITEFKKYGKPILLADLPYAYETLGTYDKVKFFDPDNAEKLAVLMESVINGKVVFEKTEAKFIAAPFSQNWKELFDILLNSEQ